MSDKKLWSPSTTINNINLFTNFINKEVNINSYEDLHRWSIEKKEIFWDKFWQFTNIIGERVYYFEEYISGFYQKAMDISSFAKGVYFLEVSNSKSKILKKLVVE